MCSVVAEEAIAGRLFPDEIVVCGPAPAYVPYTDPGLPLARAVWQAIDHYIDEWREPPKVILMQNHGFIALGQSAREVQNITAMYVKTARILSGTYAVGGPRFMTPADVARIHTRPDEDYRKRAFGSRDPEDREQ
jgi:rhamnose utilization protein RhaD (predicted bifunctional aldolase and dehydrogenase)